MFKYADDIITLIPNEHMSNVEHCIECEIGHVKSWCEQNGLTLNKKKTQIMLVKKNIPTLSSSMSSFKAVQHLKVLGITYDHHLSWDLHIDNQCKKAAKHLFLIRTLKKFLAKEDLIRIYKTFVLPILEFCNPLFIGLLDKNSWKLEKIQRRYHHIICGLHIILDIMRCPCAKHKDDIIHIYHTAPHCTTILGLSIQFACSSTSGNTYFEY